jgi:hypothetical protein
MLDFITKTKNEKKKKKKSLYLLYVT